jgi:hypothetical protein
MTKDFPIFIVEIALPSIKFNQVFQMLIDYGMNIFKENS